MSALYLARTVRSQATGPHGKSLAARLIRLDYSLAAVVPTAAGPRERGGRSHRSLLFAPVGHLTSVAIGQLYSVSAAVRGATQGVKDAFRRHRAVRWARGGVRRPGGCRCCPGALPTQARRAGPALGPSREATLNSKVATSRNVALQLGYSTWAVTAAAILQDHRGRVASQVPTTTAHLLAALNALSEVNQLRLEDEGYADLLGALAYNDTFPAPAVVAAAPTGAPSAHPGLATGPADVALRSHPPTLSTRIRPLTHGTVLLRGRSVYSGHEASASGSDGYNATLLRNESKGPCELPTGLRADSGRNRRKHMGAVGRTRSWRPCCEEGAFDASLLVFDPSSVWHRR